MTYGRLYDFCFVLLREEKNCFFSKIEFFLMRLLFSACVLSIGYREMFSIETRTHVSRWRVSRRLIGCCGVRRHHSTQFRMLFVFASHKTHRRRTLHTAAWFSFALRSWIPLCFACKSAWILVFIVYVCCGRAHHCNRTTCFFPILAHCAVLFCCFHFMLSRCFPRLWNYFDAN